MSVTTTDNVLAEHVIREWTSRYSGLGLASCSCQSGSSLNRWEVRRHIRQVKRSYRMTLKLAQARKETELALNALERQKI